MFDLYCNQFVKFSELFYREKKFKIFYEYFDNLENIDIELFRFLWYETTWKKVYFNIEIFCEFAKFASKEASFFQWKMKRLRPTSMEALPLIWQMYFLTRREKENSFVSKCNSNFFSHVKVILLAEYPLWNNVKLSWFL